MTFKALFFNMTLSSKKKTVNIQQETVFHLQSHEMLNFMLQRETAQLGLRFCLLCFQHSSKNLTYNCIKQIERKREEGQVKIKEKEED